MNALLTDINLQEKEQEKTVFHWGGLAGILGSIIFILVFIIVGVFVGENPTDLTEWIARFPTIRMARTVENGGYILALILWVPHFLALYILLRRTNLAFALFGSVLSIVGVTVLVAGALPHVAMVPLSDIFQGVETTAAEQTALALMWQASWGIFDALFFAGLIVMAAGVLSLGIAMLSTSAFSKGMGWFSVVVGVLGMIAGVVLLIDPGSLIAVVSVFSLIFFHLLVGWKVFRFSQLPY